MHIHSLLALTLAVTTSALPSLPGCLVSDENRSRACREVGPVQSKQEIVDGQKQQNRGSLQSQIEYVDQQIGKEIECPGCGKNIVGDLVQSRSIGHNNMITGQGEQQLDMINGKTHEEWMGVGHQQQQDSMPHGQKSNFKTSHNQKRNQHLGQLFDGQSNNHGSMNMDTGKTQQDELLTKGQGVTQEHDITHNWANQLNQGQNQKQQEQINKGTQQIEGLYNAGNANGVIQDFNNGGRNQQLYNGQQMGANQLYKTGQNGILMTTNQFYQGQPINTQQLNNNNNNNNNKGQRTQKQQQEFNKGQQTQQLNNGNGNQQTTQELIKTTNGIQVRHETGEHFNGQNEQGREEQFSGNSQSKQQQEQIEIGGQQKKNPQEEQVVVFSPQQMMAFIASQSKKQGQQQQQWVREQVVTSDGKQQEVWTCV